MSKQYYIYILPDKHNSVLYTGLTNELYRRVSEHKVGEGGTFPRKYNIDKLVFYEFTNDINAAIAREKQIKAGSRQHKIDLIVGMNPGWDDLSLEL
jgi:putative endonuclease